MDNLPQASHAAAPTSYSQDAHPERTTALSRGLSLNIGADHITPCYLEASGVATRRAELCAEGYSINAAAFVTRLEGRENTLLDRTDLGLTPAETAELRALQALLWELQTDANTAADVAPMDAADEAPREPSERLATIRRVKSNVPVRELLRRLLNARAVSLQKTTGEDADDTRHRAVFDATRGRTDSSVDRTLTDDEMGDAVSFVEDRLHAAGFDFEAADAEYRARRFAREMAAIAEAPALRAARLAA